jgi:hypothetical protein
MGYRFNPPPNWPPPPPGWSPPPGWRPDPSWPPPPHGWQLWVLEEEPAGPPPTPPAPSSPPPATQRPRRRVRAWFASLPAWAKLLVVLLVVLLVLGLLPWLLIAAGLALAAIGLVALLRGPLPRLKVPSRAAAVGALLLGLVGIAGGSALAVAVLNPSPPPTTSRPLVAPTTRSTLATAAPTTAPPSTTTPPATTRPPTTTAKKPATTHPPRSSSPASTARPVSLCGAPPNPYGYNFCGRGGYVTNPPADVCDYFDCIDNFWNGRGHMQECRDHTYSMSGGRPGSCSYHGGNLRPVYRGP